MAPGRESHFKVVVVSQAFEGQRLLGRHRQVNGVLAEELAGPFMRGAAYLYRAGVATAGAGTDHPSCVSKTASPKAIDELITQSATS